MFGFRNDAKKVKDIPPFNKVMPFLLKKRVDSLVYFKQSVNMSPAIQFVKAHNKENPDAPLRLFNILLAAFIRTTALYPKLNRFLIGPKVYQRNELSINFVVKKDISIEGEERNALVYFEQSDTIYDVARRVNAAIDETRELDDSELENMLRYVFMLPTFIIKFVFFVLRGLEKIGLYPKAVREVDGLHVSCFISNLGSIGLPDAPFHHLYDWGTTSIFITSGSILRSREEGPHGEVIRKETMNLAYTIDERIADGFYLIQAMRELKRNIENPELLTKAPDLSMVVQ